MLGGLAQAGTKALGGARFSLVNLMPISFLVGFFIILITSGLYGGGDLDFGKVAEKFGGNAGWAIALVFGVFLLAVLLRPFQVAVVQFLEGDWPRWTASNYVTALAIERHRRTRQTAEVVCLVVSGDDPEVDLQTTSALHDVAVAQRHRQRVKAILTRASATIARYPSPRQGREYGDRLMPTLLGNVLRDGEDNAGQRYGLSFRAVAQRMYPSISPKLGVEISQNLDLIDTTAAMCIAFAIASVSSLPFVSRWDRWSFTPLVAAALSVLAYRGAISIARRHAQLLATVFDLHRFDMLAALHYKLPITPGEEIDFNRKLSDFLNSGDTAEILMEGVDYVHPSSVAPLDQGKVGRIEPELDGSK